MFSERATVTPVKPFGGYRKKTGSQKYTVICLTLIGLCLVGTGIALIIVGKEYDVQDLLILGPIFLVAGIGFTILMFFIIARPFFEKKARKKEIQEEDKRKRKKEKKKSNVRNNENMTKNESKPYIRDCQKKLDEAEDVEKRKSPSQKQLYGKANKNVKSVPDVLPPGVVEIKSDGYSTDDNSDIDKGVLKSSPAHEKLYGSPVHFSVSSNPSPPPDTVQPKANPVGTSQLPDTSQPTESPVRFSLSDNPSPPPNTVKPTASPVHLSYSTNLTPPPEDENTVEGPAIYSISSLPHENTLPNA